MSKLDNNIINNIKMLGLDMISKEGYGDVGITVSSANIFYTLYNEFLKFNPKDNHFINRDRVIVSERLLPLYNATNKFFYQKSDILSDTKVTSNPISFGVGVALGRRYLEELIRIEDNKNDLINFTTYVICTIDDLMNGTSYEATSFASIQKLTKLVIIVISDGISKDCATKEVFKEHLTDRFISLDFDFDEVNGNSIASIAGALDDATTSKKPAVIIVKNTYGKGTSREDDNNHFNRPLSENELTSLRKEYGLNNPLEIKEEYLNEIDKNIERRLGKYLNKWQNNYNVSKNDLKIKEVIEFLENQKVNVTFNPDNIKINDNYSEELVLSNKKVFNILANHSPFILSASNDNFSNTLTSITKSKIMHKESPTERNILFGNRTLAMGAIASGLASLGFKIFLSSPISELNYLIPNIMESLKCDLPIHYTVTINRYDDTKYLKNIPELITFEPTDIDELVGVYELLTNYSKPTVTILSKNKIPKLIGTNHKYVLAGAYPITKHATDIDGILISEGENLLVAQALYTNLEKVGINLRLISMPSASLFKLQKETYKEMLLNKNIKTFYLGNYNPEYLDLVTNRDYYLNIIDYLDDSVLNLEELQNDIIDYIKN